MPLVYHLIFQQRNAMNQNLSILINELKNRARIYILIYRELVKEVGKEKAVAILKAALYARGKEKGVQLAKKIGKPDLHKLGKAFMESAGDMDAFGHEIVEETPHQVILRLNHCPLAEAWDDANLAPEEKKILCDIAYQVDFGKFEAAGYNLSFNCRAADGEKCCDLRVSI
jgi:predicted ArsR family transcriptional regulator